MPRPTKCRKIDFQPKVLFFKPAGMPLHDLEEVVLTLDELEALRLADLEGLYQEDASAQMGVSRPTFGNIVSSARKKTADALLNGKAIRIEGGVVEKTERRFICLSCGHEWSRHFGTGCPTECPKCGSINFGRHPDDPCRKGQGKECGCQCGHPEK